MESESPPDIAIDFTRIGPNSEGVKAVLRSVEIPTIAGTFGQEYDLRYRNSNLGVTGLHFVLSSNFKSLNKFLYLIQGMGKLDVN